MADDTLFQTERYGKNFKYVIPVSNATYSVSLHFVEMYQTTASARLFGVSVQGESVLAGFDLFSEVGYEVAYTVRVDDVVVSDETLTISLSATSI